MERYREILGSLYNEICQKMGRDGEISGFLYPSRYRENEFPLPPPESSCHTWNPPSLLPIPSKIPRYEICPFQAEGPIVAVCPGSCPLVPKICPFTATTCTSLCTMIDRSQYRFSIAGEAVGKLARDKWQSRQVRGSHDRGEPRIWPSKGFGRTCPTQVFPVVGVLALRCAVSLIQIECHWWSRRASPDPPASNQP
jgi:hypothetical protein